MRTYPGDDPQLRAAGTRAAVTALRSGRLVLAPADFHYAVLTDAFSATGVARMYNIEIYKTQGMRFDRYPVDFAYFTYGIASVELSAPPTDDSRPWIAIYSPQNMSRTIFSSY